MSVWKTLSAIDCSKQVEKKGNLSYLSWTWAWGILMQHFPDSVYEMGDDKLHDDGTVTVFCGVTVQGTRRDMWLPVMDNKNNSVKNPTSRQISDAKMRCLVKAIAMHGLGIYIYAGEDLPIQSDDPISDAQFTALNAALDETGSDKIAFCKVIKVDSLKDLKASKYDAAMAMIEKKRAAGESNANA